MLDEFIDDYEQMHRFAQSLRQAAENDEPGNASQLVGDEYDSVMEGRYLLGLHRVWERKPALREKKIRNVLAHGALSDATTWSRCIKPENAPTPSVIWLCCAVTAIA